MKRNALSFTVFLSLLALTGCASYYTVAPDDLAMQLKGDRNSESRMEAMSVSSPVLSDRFNADNVHRLLCLNQSRDSTWVYPNKDTQLQISMRSGEIVSMYFDTIVLDGTTLKGVTSRVQKSVGQADLTNILKIEIYTVNSKTELVHPK